jgi:Ca-activated chloride channel family protein
VVIAPQMEGALVAEPEIVALLAAFAALLLVALAEWLHARRVRRLAHLAFGPRGRPAAWARAAPVLRALAFGALAWGLATLLLIPPKRYTTEDSGGRREKDPQHVLMVLDVSPSMRLVDAGPKRDQSRMQRVREVMGSFFDRVPLESYRVSVVAVYNGAKPVVVDTQDFEVVNNILGDLPLHFAFQSGKTKLFDGLEEAVKLAQPWNPGSTTLILVSDGDTVPAKGMPQMPASIKSVIVVGIGDPRTGKFIDGRQSRQDVATLKQIAARLSGSYHDGNAGHISSGLIADAFGREDESVFKKLTMREYALIAAACGGLMLALLPLCLHLFGTLWRPGARRGRLTAPQEPSESALGRSRNRGPLAGVG